MGDLEPLASGSPGVDVPNMLFMVAGATLMHCQYSAMGYLFVDAEDPRASQEQLLNNLEEGVFIVEKDCSGICFLNSAARNFMCNPDFDLSKVSDDGAADDILFDWDKQMFAEVKKHIFHQAPNVDAA